RRRKRTKEEMLQDEEMLIDPVARPIAINHLHQLLRNQFYIGKIKGNNNAWIPSVSHMPLIDEPLFQRVQAALSRKNVSVHYAEKLHFPYRGLIRCSVCNRVYTPYEQKGHHYYGVRCIPGCSNSKRSINADFITVSI